MQFPANIALSVGLLGLGAARTVPLAWSIPAFGGPALPARLRVTLGIGLAALCFPALAASVPPSGAIAWLLLGLREVLVGVVMGFVCACMFRAAEAAGELMDVLLGSAMAGSLSPVGEARTSPLGALLLLFATVVFLEIGGLGHVASALGRSYEAIPLGTSPSLAERSHAAGILAIVASGRLIESAVGLAAPVLVSLLLVDIALGVIGRAVPRLQLQILGAPLKALLGVGVVLLGLGSMDLAIQGGFRGFWQLLAAAFQLAR